MILDLFWEGFKDLVNGPATTLVLGPMTDEQVEQVLADGRQAYYEKHRVRLDAGSLADTRELLGLPSHLEARQDDMARELDMPNYKGTAAENIEALRRIKKEIAKRTVKIPKE